MLPVFSDDHTESKPRSDGENTALVLLHTHYKLCVVQNLDRLVLLFGFLFQHFLMKDNRFCINSKDGRVIAGEGSSKKAS